MSTRRKVLASAVVAVAVAGSAACNTPTEPARGPASASTPVVFVHGWFEGNGVWSTFEDRMEMAGYRSGDITKFGYDSTAQGEASAAKTIAGQLAGVVDTALASARANGNPDATKVDIVSHSYGSMVTRYCITLGGCAGKVAHWSSLAGADGGTAIATIPAALGQGSGVDMSPNSATVRLLKTPENIQKVVDQGIKIQVQWSPNDGVIIPPENSQWPSPENPDPASNKQLPSSVNHMSILTDQQVMAETIRFFAS